MPGYEPLGPMSTPTDQTINEPCLLKTHKKRRSRSFAFCLPVSKGPLNFRPYLLQGLEVNAADQVHPVPKAQAQV